MKDKWAVKAKRADELVADNKYRLAHLDEEFPEHTAPSVEDRPLQAESTDEKLVREAATAFPVCERWLAGVQALTLEDLLNEILGINRPAAVLKIIAELRSVAHLGHSQPAELAGQFGLTLNRAKKLLAAIELGRRANNAPRTEYPCIKSPADAADLLREMGELEQEQMRVLIMDTKNRVSQISTVYQGSVHTTVIRINELFREAVRCNATALIVAHNHPSGDPTPSPEDVAVTREISQAGKLLDIDVLDHVVIGSGGRFVSLKERGLGFGS